MWSTFGEGGGEKQTDKSVLIIAPRCARGLGRNTNGQPANFNAAPCRNSIPLTPAGWCAASYRRDNVTPVWCFTLLFMSSAQCPLLAVFVPCMLHCCTCIAAIASRNFLSPLPFGSSGFYILQVYIYLSTPIC